MTSLKRMQTADMLGCAAAHTRYTNAIFRLMCSSHTRFATQCAAYRARARRCDLAGASSDDADRRECQSGPPTAQGVKAHDKDLAGAFEVEIMQIRVYAKLGGVADGIEPGTTL